MAARRGRRCGVAGDTSTPSPPAEADEPGDPESLARAIVLRQLAMAARTRSQLAQAMARRAVPEDVAERVLDRFTELGLVDDAEYARQWVTSRQQVKGLAPRALAQELRRRGVADELVRDAVSVVRPEDEVAAATRLVERRWVEGEDEQRQVRRLTAMLARRGYSASVAMRAIRERAASSEDESWDVDD
ncbi:MAG: regulatory protein RecX [Kineosporiaceae bacterium]